MSNFDFRILQLAASIYKSGPRISQLATPILQVSNFDFTYILPSFY